MRKKIIIVGAGLTGSVIARQLAEENYQVTIIEQRKHIAGNLYDQRDEWANIYVQMYGPHIFHTVSDQAMNYVNQFTELVPTRVQTSVRMFNPKTEKLEHFNGPFCFNTIEQLYSKEKANKLINDLKAYFPNRESVPITELLSSTKKSINEFATYIWENNYKQYTAKQWGMKPSEVDQTVLSRVPFVMGYNATLFADKYEGIPKDGYTNMFKRLLKHKNIQVVLNTNANDKIELKEGKTYYDGEEVILIHTGEIDKLFNYQYGKLNYRSLKFRTFTSYILKERPNPVTLYPNTKYPFTRMVNYGLFPYQPNAKRWVYSFEYPLNADEEHEPYYPTNTETDKATYQRYVDLAKTYPSLFMTGRLGQYKYLNMDQCVLIALAKVEEIKQFLKV